MFDRVDAMVGGCVIVGMIGFSVALGRVDRQARWGEEGLERARAAVLSRLEQVADYRPFADALRAFNADPADDPGGPGSAPGDRFEVEGLPLPASRELHGRIEFFLDETVTSGPGAGETMGGFPDYLGLPRDLNGDGDFLDPDVSERYRILPVRVSVRWESVRGTREIQFYGSRFGGGGEGLSPFFRR